MAESVITFGDVEAKGMWVLEVASRRCGAPFPELPCWF